MPWAASSFRTVKAVWQSYQALHAHFKEKSGDMTCYSKERAKFLGFMRKFKSAVFLKNLTLMFDALEELSDLSLALQKANNSLAIAHRLISRQIEVFEARKETQNDDKYAEACKAVQEKRFGGVNVSKQEKKRKYTKGNFINHYVIA